MLLEFLGTLLLNLLLTFATTNSHEEINIINKDINIESSKKIVRRQAPWGFPEASFSSPVYVPPSAPWRYYPCKPYPSFPFPSTPPNGLPRPTPPSSSSDDPNEILDKMSGVMGRSKSKDEPSRCVWAVVSCCSPGSRDIRYSCFELLGCPGAFWDVNPCDDKVVMAAAESALNFYAGKNNGTAPTTP